MIVTDPPYTRSKEETKPMMGKPEEIELSF